MINMKPPKKTDSKTNSLKLLSLNPLKPEEAIKALLQTKPPPKEKQDKKSKKARVESGFFIYALGLRSI